MISFNRLDVNHAPWDEITSFSGATIFHTLPWMTLLMDTQEAEPVVAAVQSDGQVQGYFMGLITRKFSLKILGSPFRGWGTYFMGFVLKPGVSYHEVLLALPKFAFGELKCHYLEITDMNMQKREWQDLSFHGELLHWFALDLTKSREELFANMKGNSCRRAIRGAIKKGVEIEETTDPGFADEYFAQYQQVMAGKSLIPAYRLEFVRKMIAQLLPMGTILLLRARNPEGACIATAIFLVYSKVSIYWGGASLKQYLGYHPNELLFWYAMRRLKAMGVEVLHMGGGAKEFKRKLGCHEAQVYRLMKSKYYFLEMLIGVVSSLRETRVRNWGLKALGR